MPVSGSSNTSSPTSRKWCTSEAPPPGTKDSPVESLRGLIRLTHPFPTVLTATLTGAIAILAGGGLPTAARLGAAMLLLQASIGALNDLLDLDDDRPVKPSKPLVAGVVGRGQARAIVAVGLVGGLGLALVSGPMTLVLAAAGVSAGYLYDLRLKRTPWGPLAFAIGVPLLPVFAWFGAVGTLPGLFAALVPAAFLAGLGLALSNAIADDRDDRASGVVTAVGRVGVRAAWWTHLAAFAATIAIAMAALLAAGAKGPALWVVGVGCLLVVAGIVAARPGGRGRRPHGWEIEAVGLGVLATGWLLVLLPGTT